jgi:hypothetical protein
VTEAGSFVEDDEVIFSGWLRRSHFPADGTSDGYICSDDLSAGQTWFFDAPADWLGDQSDLYGGTLNFVLRQSETDNPYDDADVVLVGDDLTLAYDTAQNPLTDWTAYIVPLRETDGWFIAQEKPALPKPPGAGRARLAHGAAYSRRIPRRR